MLTGTRWFALPLMLALLAAGTARGQFDPFGPTEPKTEPKKEPTPEEKKKAEEARDPRKILASLPFEVREVEELPDDVKATAAIFPIGKKDYGYKGCLYVPSYYDASRPWPLLVEGVEKHMTAEMLRRFYLQAEKHGFLYLSVEYLFARGASAGTQQHWSREGSRTTTNIQRPLVDFQTDMAVDEKVLLATLKEVGDKYNVEQDAVGITGFLFSGVMAYRMVVAYPKVFCMAVGRSAGFHEAFMPDDASRARNRYVYVILGEKETTTLTAAQAAIDFFKKNGFKKLLVERIPNSGVDIRADVTANYFRGTFEEILGPEKCEFFRVHKMAMQCLMGVRFRDAETAGDMAQPKKDNKDSDPEKKDESPAPKPPASEPPSPTTVMNALSQFSEQYPKSAFKAQCRFLMGRIAMEKLDDKAQADKLLREFADPPLLSSPVAPAAVLYLVEKVIDQDAQLNEAVVLLAKIMNRREAPADVRDRARELRKELMEKRASQGD
ncbi:MAG: hypothetical protein JXL80_06140 [Planctomycetes bacterium]|nr:hypothetical protein [Planctomycetota bacterium]